MLNTILGTELTISTFLILMASALVLGICNALIFSFRTKHSKSFLFALALLPMIVSMVILMVNGNIGTGVAVAGAFALVRFRSMPGTAREIAAIFTSMTLGLAVGTGYLGLAVIFFLIAAVFTLCFALLPFFGQNTTEKQLKITIPENYDFNGLFDEVFQRFGIRAELDKIRTTNMGTLIELTYKAEFPQNVISKEFLDEIRSRNGNLNVLIGSFSEKESL